MPITLEEAIQLLYLLSSQVEYFDNRFHTRISRKVELGELILIYARRSVFLTSEILTDPPQTSATPLAVRATPSSSPSCNRTTSLS